MIDSTQLHYSTIQYNSYDYNKIVVVSIRVLISLKIIIEFVYTLPGLKKVAVWI